MNEADKTWWVTASAAVAAAVAGLRLKWAKSRKAHAEAQKVGAEAEDINIRTMRRIISSLEHELKRVRGEFKEKQERTDAEIKQLREQNAMQAGQILSLTEHNRHCDENNARLRIDLDELKKHVQRIEVLKS